MNSVTPSCHAVRCCQPCGCCSKKDVLLIKDVGGDRGDGHGSEFNVVLGLVGNSGAHNLRELEQEQGDAQWLSRKGLSHHARTTD